MINFFRRIRQNLLNEGKTSKYLKYAIGEIVLVVIGILIALQINTWNTKRLDSNLETKIIKELKSNLQFDLEELSADIRHMDSVNLATTFMIEFIKTNSIPNKSFFYAAAKLRVATHFDPNKSGYSLLTSKGLEIISNDSLRKSISKLYETRYSYYLKYEEERVVYRANYTAPKLEYYFTMIPRPELTYKGEFQISQEDYEVLKNDHSFLKMLNTVIYENSLIQSRAKKTSQDIHSLLDQLNAELKP